jgi:hypothetical protein
LSLRTAAERAHLSNGGAMNGIESLSTATTSMANIDLATSLSNTINNNSVGSTFDVAALQHDAARLDAFRKQLLLAEQRLIEKVCNV